MSFSSPKSATQNQSTGLLLVGHGTRNERGRDEFLQTAELVRQHLPRFQVEPCFLEFCQPTIREGVERLLARDVSSLTAVPLLLLTAGHVQRDIPEAVKEALAEHGEVLVSWASPLECHPQVLQLSARRYLQALESCGKQDAMPTSLVMVGRGSREQSATGQMQRFVDLRRSLTPVEHCLVGYLSMAEPTLEQALAQAAEADVERVVVQPHLLFTGDLLERLDQTVQSARQRWPDREWILTGHLGVDLCLALAVADRFEETRLSPSA